MGLEIEIIKNQRIIQKNTDKIIGGNCLREGGYSKQRRGLFSQNIMLRLTSSRKKKQNPEHQPQRTRKKIAKIYS